VAQRLDEAEDKEVYVKQLRRTWPSKRIKGMTGCLMYSGSKHYVEHRPDSLKVDNSAQLFRSVRDVW
jgi:hypothetical protein